MFAKISQSHLLRDLWFMSCISRLRIEIKRRFMLSLVCIESCGAPERGEESRAPAQCWRPNLLALLVSTYVVCERLSVMQRQTRLPEIFDQIPHFTPEVKFGFSGEGREVEFSSEFISDLFYITPPPEVKFGYSGGGVKWHFLLSF